MKPTQAAAARYHLDHRLAPYRDDKAIARPPRGWIRAIRDALGMSAAVLGQRMGVSQVTASKLEKSEVEDRITLKSLRAAAEALDCRLVYALVPNRPLEEVVTAAARRVAEQRIGRTNHSMALENQAIGAGELEAERARLADDLVRRDLRALWNELPARGR